MLYEECVIDGILCRRTEEGDEAFYEYTKEELTAMLMEARRAHAALVPKQTASSAKQALPSPIEKSAIDDFLDKLKKERAGIPPPLTPFTPTYRPYTPALTPIAPIGPSYDPAPVFPPGVLPSPIWYNNQIGLASGQDTVTIATN